jgi:hypothetical protein
MEEQRWKWKFYVKGSLTQEGAVVPAYSAIVESGERDEASPHCLRGVGPIAHPKDDGLFYTWYVTTGGADPIDVPRSLSVFLQVERGKWKLHVISLAGRSTEVLSNTELLVELGTIPIDPEETIYVPEH